MYPSWLKVNAMRRGGWLVFMGVSGGVSVKMFFFANQLIH